MARKKVKLASGLTVRSGDKVIVTITGRYAARMDQVVADDGCALAAQISESVRNHGTSCITVVKVKKTKAGEGD